MVVIILNQSGVLDNTSKVYVNEGDTGTKLHVDIDKLNEIKNKILEKIKESNNDKNKSKLEEILTSVNKISKLSEEDEDSAEREIEVVLYVGDDNNIKIYPNIVIYDKSNDINICNCFGDSKCTIEIDATEVSNIIAFEIIYNELGEDFESIENILNNVGINKIHDASELSSNFYGTNLVGMAEEFMIGESPYIDVTGEYINDYFNMKKFPLHKGKHNHYMDVIKYSCEHAMSLIIANTIKAINKKGINAAVAYYTDSYIYVICNSSLDDKLTDCIDDVIIRAFGRQFRVKLKMKKVQ